LLKTKVFPLFSTGRFLQKAGVENYRFFHSNGEKFNEQIFCPL